MLKDEAGVVGLRQCSEHGPEILLQSIHLDDTYYMVEARAQLELTRDPEHEDIVLGLIYEIVPTNTWHGLEGSYCFKIRKCHGHPKTITKSFEDLFDALELLDDHQGEA